MCSHLHWLSPRAVIIARTACHSMLCNSNNDTQFTGAERSCEYVCDELYNSMSYVLCV